MYIDCFKNNGLPYLRVVESLSVNEGGKRKCMRRTVRNIGSLANYDDGEPDFLGRLRRSFADGSPIIESLSDLCGVTAPRRDIVNIPFDRNSRADTELDTKNIGYLVLDSLFDSLGIYDVLNRHKSDSKIEYDLVGIARLLVVERAFDPDSKIAAWRGRDSFLFPVVSPEVQPIHVYRALDVLDELSLAIQKRMHHRICVSIGRNLNVCFYDVTNFFFEIHANDPDEAGGNGKAARKGLRKIGVSKENRRQPIVQTGLFVDDNGIPIAYHLFSGSNTDQTTLIPALEKGIHAMKFGKVTVIADGGLNSGPNIAALLNGGNGYIFPKGTRKTDAKTRKWILDEEGYVWNASRTFKSKSMVRTRKITAVPRSDGKPAVTMEITKKIVSYWSESYCQREMHENEEFMEYVESVRQNPDKLKDRPKKVEKFMKKMQIDCKTGEVLENAKTVLYIDFDKVDGYRELMGYCTLMTSEVGLSDDQIISRYHGLNRIEDSFRTTKGTLEGRPVHVSRPEHINAHFLTCFVALTMYRLIQHRILVHRGKDTHSLDGWESGLSANRIQKALHDWEAQRLPKGYCLTSSCRDDLETVLSALGVDGDLRLPDERDLRRLKRDIDAVTLA